MDTNNSGFFTEQPKGFLVVGIGASAGGVQALKEFFEHVPDNSNLAYVVILHLSPDHDSKLAEILQHVTTIPVLKVTEKTHLQPNHIYVVSPNQHLIMEDEFVIPSINVYVEERRAPVDVFFRTLADNLGPRAICVVLSGTGANGSMGLKRIKEMGGVAYAQNPREAEFNEMPRNAIATELVDEVLPVAEIPRKVIAYRDSLGTVEIAVDSENRPEQQQQALREIFTLLRVRTGHDFVNYKRPTLLRRIERRINIRNLPDLSAYVSYVHENLDEVNSLLKDLLISVTNFFRDKKSFEFLEEKILPAIFKAKKADQEVRIWVAGCATGEEAFSLAMLAAERNTNASEARKVQIFATDIDEAAIAKAREGLYTLNDAADISPERLLRFFNKEGDSYRVKREIREMIIFAAHNFLKDPPFSHLDLVTCRNVLIYLNSTAQERVMETFHFALNPGGFLFLGNSESVDGSGDLYATVSREHHIFQAREVSSRTYPIPQSVPSLTFSRVEASRKNDDKEEGTYSQVLPVELHQKLLEQYAPPSVIINEDHDIVHMSQKVGIFLEFSGGEPSRNLLKLVRPELRLELRSALYQAEHHQTAIEARNITWGENGARQTVTIHVKPVVKDGDTAKGFSLVIFSLNDEQPDTESLVLTSDEPVAKQLEEELIQLKAQLKKSGEQHLYQEEELKASNEELQALVEELRSAAEELETSREELQSINEELRTVNQELKVKIEEVSISSNNLRNLINSADVGTVFLDRSFRTRLYTPAILDIFNLIPSDYGRPLSDITHRLEYDSLLEDVHTVLEKLAVVEREVTTTDKRNFLMRILPYRTAEDRINGVVMTFFDITKRKTAELALQQSEQYLRLVIESASDFAILTQDPQRRITKWNHGAEIMMGYSEEEVMGMSMDMLFTPEDRASHQPEKEVQCAEKEGRYENERWHVRKDGSRFWGSGSVSPILDNEGKLLGFVKIMRDLTGQKQKEEALRISEAKLAEELADSRKLQQISETLIESGNIQSVYDEILNAAIFIMESDMASIQMLEEEKNELQLLTWKGFHPQSAVFWQSVTAEGSSACGISLAHEVRTIVEDIETCEFLKNSEDLHYFRLSNIKAVQSTPLISRSGKLVGMISTHWTTVHTPSERKLQLLDVLARQAADLIERNKAEEALRQSKDQLTAIFQALPVGIGFLDNQGETIFSNDEMRRYLPTNIIPSRDDRRFQLWRAFHPDGTRVERQDFPGARALRGEQVVPGIEMLYTPEDGNQVWTRVSSVPLKDDEGKTAGAVAVVTDISELIQASEALREREERWRKVLSIETVGVIYLDLKGGIHDANAAFANMSGFSREEILGGKARWEDITPAEFYEVSLKARQEYAEKGQNTPYEKQYIRPDGSRWWGLVAGMRLNENEFVEFVIDITARKRAEDALRGSEARLRTLADAVPQVIWTNNADGKANYFNQRWYEYSGLSYEQSVGVGWQAIVHPDDEPASREKWEQALAAGEVFDTEYRLRRYDGTYCWFIGRNVPMLDESGKVTSWFGSATDVDNLKKTEQALGQSEARLKITMESATDHAIITMDTNRRVERWSMGATLVFGYTEAEMVGRSADIIFTEDDRKAGIPQQEMETALQNGRAIDERWHQRKDGSRFFVSGVMRPIQNEELTGYVKVLRDMTQQQLFTEELHRLVAERTRELQRSNEDLRQFAHVASHDLKEPVRKIRTFNNRLKDEFSGILPKKGQIYLDKVESATSRMYAMIDGVLNYSKVNNTPRVHESVDLNVIIKQIETDLEVLIDTKKAVVTTGPLPTVTGSNILLYQLFYNLLLNSLKFSTAGETPLINVSSSIIHKDNREYHQISVSDNGIGFDPEYAQVIFNTFTRLNPTDEYEGSGLGLALCQKIAERHNGSISATGSENKGAIFTVLLPLVLN